MLKKQNHTYGQRSRLRLLDERQNPEWSFVLRPTLGRVAAKGVRRRSDGRLSAIAPIADIQFIVDPSGMSFRMIFSAVGAAAAGIALGWFAHQYYTNEPCRFMAQGYKSVRLDTQSLQKFPLDRVPDGVFLAVQRCWAGTPYEGPIHVLELVDAFETKSRDYYPAFEPSGVTDVQILFLISRGDGKPVAAFQQSTL